ncbi:serine hydrolase domain-containing protein [Nonomuraea sp. NPDC048901]|uniref:serine hydrolase domain-containing protein n=1 Tax=Nonomuraea sp. NPDC048901 TaxID=3155627 RepID=UPI003400CD84
MTWAHSATWTSSPTPRAAGPPHLGHSRLHGKREVRRLRLHHPLQTDRPGQSRTDRAPQGQAGTDLYSTTNYVLLGMIIEKPTGHDRAGEFKRRLFAPLGMKHTYLATKVSDQIKSPHGPGYHPDAKGRPRDVDRLNATIGAEGAISTAHDVSAYYRALNQGKLLPADLLCPQTKYAWKGQRGVPLALAADPDSAHGGGREACLDGGGCGRRGVRGGDRLGAGPGGALGAGAHGRGGDRRAGRSGR